MGVVGLKKPNGNRVVGGFFKGDFELGVEGSFAQFLTSENKPKGYQYNIGLDYSFGPFFIKLTKYFQKHNTISFSTPTPEYTGLSSKNYYLSEVTIPCDEFASFNLVVMHNDQDKSSLLISRFNYLLSSTNVMDISFMFPTGVNDKEFSISKYGGSNLIVRWESYY